MINRNGYILLETLAAILILSVGVITLSRALLAPAHAFRACRHTTQAYRIVNEKCDELRLGLSEPKDSHGTITIEGDIYKWTVETRGGSDLVRSVIITVCWNDSGAEKSLGLSGSYLDRNALVETASR